MALLNDLQSSMNSLEKYKFITARVLQYLPEVISSKCRDKSYIIIKSVSGNTEKYARPYNENLFIDNQESFSAQFDKFTDILKRCKSNDYNFNDDDFITVDRIAYTIQQSIGIGLDLLGNQNANRKHVGNRFEELIRLLVREVGINNKKVVLKIPYEDQETYSCETDLVLSPVEDVKSDSFHIDENEVVISLKTSSKDRMGKIFMDKLLMSKFTKQDVKVIGIFLNDVQRKEQNKISYTFVAGLFMVYTKFLTKLDGVYYIDPPPNAFREPYKKHIRRFSDFLLTDIKQIFRT